MYFWRIEKLKQSLVERPLSEREVLPYLVVYVGLSSAVLYIPQDLVNVWDYLGAIGNILLAVLGTLYAYHKNGGAQGSHFLQRYFAIGWVVALRWIVAGSCIMVAFYASLMVAGDPLEETSWYEFLFFMALGVAVYGSIGRHIGDVVREKNNVSIPPTLR